MTLLEGALQSIQEIGEGLKPLERRLGEVAERLPPEADEVGPLLIAARLRSNLECIHRDSLAPAVRELHDVAGTVAREVREAKAWQERRSAAATLLSELLAREEPERGRLLENPRFQSPDLVELLLEESGRHQLGSPQEAESLARLAGRIADRLPPDAGQGPEVSARSRYLAGNALRLQGELDAAETAFARAASLVDRRADRALFSRGLALLRWEQGRLDEGVALLARAAELFIDSQLYPDAHACGQLLGLLYAEMAQPGKAILHLEPAQAADPAVRPWLSARASLTLAYALAGRDRQRAREVLRQAVGLYPSIQDPEELTFLVRLEGRAHARLGDLDMAEALLDRVYRKRLQNPRGAELALASLDLLALRIAAGLSPKLAELVKAQARLAPEEGREIVTEGLRSLRQRTRSGEDPWRCADDLSFWLLRMLRLHRVRLEPLPFA